MKDNRSAEERVKDFRTIVENAPPHICAEFLPAVERAEKLMEQRRAELPKANHIKKTRKQEGMILKKIELEIEFPDDFMPPETFDKSLCSGLCPFLSYEPDECSDAFCCIVGERGKCPIRKYFESSTAHM